MTQETIRNRFVNLRALVFANLLFVLLVEPLFAFDGEDQITGMGSLSLDAGSKHLMVGHGRFSSGAQVLGLGLGATYGMRILGSSEQHHLLLSSVFYGRMIGSIKGAEGWGRGKFELCAEMLGGAQFHPVNAKLIGLAGLMRYNLAGHLPWVPYAGLGGGVTLTEIRKPDLGGAFQFNLQALLGLDYWFGQRTGLGLELRYAHLSSAGIYSPNRGVNTVGVFIGIKSLF